MKIKIGWLVARLAAAALSGMAVAAAVPTASAVSLLAATTTSSKPASATNFCTDFAAHLAADLGVSGSQLRSASVSAFKQTVTDAVKAGRVSPARAANLEAKAGQGGACSAFRLPQRQARLRQAYLSAAASVLHLSSAQLRSDVKAGQSLSQLAQSKNLSEAQFRSDLVAILKPKLAQAVAAHQLSGPAEQRILRRLESGPLPLWSRAGHGGWSASRTSTT